MRQVQVAMASAKERTDAFPHMMMSGPPGLGKTTLADIIAREMDVKFISVLASGIKDEKDIDHLLGTLPHTGYDERGEIIDRKKVEYGILFIDEVHQMTKKMTEIMHTALEDYTVTMRKFYRGKVQPVKCWVPKFTMIGATNYLGELPKPFIDRFKIRVAFQSYSDEEMFNIVKFSSEKMQLLFSDEAIRCIVSYSRGVPRISNRFVEKARDTAIYMKTDWKNIGIECVKRMFEINQVDELGLTTLDRKVLKCLATMDRGVGVETVAHMVDEDSETVKNYVEPWLMKLGLIVRTGQGRAITELGIRHIKPEAGINPGLRIINQ